MSAKVQAPDTTDAVAAQSEPVSRPAWGEPAVTRIEIKRTMAVGGSGSDINAHSSS